MSAKSRSSLAGLVLSAIVTAAGSLHAADAPTAARTDPAFVPPIAHEPLYAAPTTFDRIGRIMAPVMLNGKGPFRFIVDTGASRSVVSPQLVERLGLEASTGTGVTIQGATGAEEVPFVLIERLEAGELRMRNVQLPVVAPMVLAGADGILGVEGFDRLRITVDFAADRISITRAYRSVPALGDWYKVPVRLRFGRLMIANVRVGNVPVKAVIDTGADRTLGNLVLRDALGLGAETHLKPGETRIIGATSVEEMAHTLAAPTVRFGQTTISGLDVTFADLHVFRLWDLEKEPALILGMDVLGTPSALMFDYRHAELQIRTGRPATNSVPPRSLGKKSLAAVNN